jgi:hypothetical protein
MSASQPWRVRLDLNREQLVNHLQTIVSALFLVCPLLPINADADGPFVWPGEGISAGVPVWGHKDGLRIGLAPTPGPRGLIRIYAPYLGQEFPRVVNFVSIEPSVVGQRGRDQSELQFSRDQPGKRGLAFWATREIDLPRPTEVPSGVVSKDGMTLRLFVHTEAFANGARPIIECLFRRESPHHVEFVTHAANDSDPMTHCVLSATMGNYGQLRQIHLKDGRVESALGLWNDEGLDHLGFLPWRTWSADQLDRTSNHRVFVQLTSDARDPAGAEHVSDVPPHWKYIGRKSAHSWMTEVTTECFVAVNGRKTYWMSQSPIPGGTAFENFELRLPFKAGNRLWFGVRPDAD